TDPMIQTEIRIGMDIGEVIIKQGPTDLDIFGGHVDRAARIQAMSKGGHILVTRAVFDAAGFLPDAGVSWKPQGSHVGKLGEQPIEIYEPYNANIVIPMAEVRGAGDLPAASSPASGASRGAVVPVMHLPRQERGDTRQTAQARTHEVLLQIRGF